MRLTDLRPIIWTDNFDETILFYQNILSFVLDERNDNWSWASLSKDNVAIMISKPNEHIAFNMPIFTGSFYFSTNDVASLWEDLKEKVNICYELETFEWGMKEFAIYDINGYILQFGENVK